MLLLSRPALSIPRHMSESYHYFTYFSIFGNHYFAFLPRYLKMRPDASLPRTSSIK
jgi:hypothetical protein